MRAGVLLLTLDSMTASRRKTRGVSEGGGQGTLHYTAEGNKYPHRKSGLGEEALLGGYDPGSTLTMGIYNLVNNYCLTSRHFESNEFFC